MRCTAQTTAGLACKANAITGGTVCNKHGGSAPQVKAHAAVRAEVMRWTLGDATDDPGQTLLRLLSQSVTRADRYAAEVEDLVAKSPNLREALVGDSWGEFGKTGEYVRGLARLEAEERDRAANFAYKAVAAGIGERQVRLAERQGELFAWVLTSIMDSGALGLSADQKRAMPIVMREALALASSAPQVKHV